MTETTIAVTPPSITILVPNTGSPIPDSIDGAIDKGWYAALPSPWAAPNGVTSKPKTRVCAKNNSLTCPVSISLVDVFLDPVISQYRTSIFAEFTTLQPGAELGNGAGELVEDLPTTSMYLVAYLLSAEISELNLSFTVDLAVYAT